MRVTTCTRGGEGGEGGRGEEQVHGRKEKAGGEGGGNEHDKNPPVFPN